MIPTPKAEPSPFRLGCRFRSLGTDTSFMVGEELTIWVDLVASTVPCDAIGGAVVFTFSVWISSADRLLWFPRRRRNPHPFG